MQNFGGVGVALVTPFNEDETVDYLALEKLIKHVIQGGVDYLVSLGTTGEVATLSHQEQQKILAFTLEQARAKVPVVVGIGGNSTTEVVEKLRTWRLEEVAAILSVSPYYSKPSQEGIYRHYAAIANAAPKPVILYNVPGRTSSNISAETTIRLANDFAGKIIGTKEASGNMVQCMHLVKNKPQNFALISGDDHLTLPLIACGFDGVISVVANAFPEKFCQLVHQALAGHFIDARSLQSQLLSKMDMLFIENNPAGVKAFLYHLGIINNILRLPLTPLSQPYFHQVKTML